MKKLLIFALVLVFAASLLINASAVVNSNHLVDQGWPKFNSDETEWDVYCWTVVDTKITALGYMLDGEEPVWLIDKIVVREDADKVKANDCFEDEELERAIIEYNLQNGLEDFYAYRIHITLDTSEMSKGIHTLEVVARYEDESEGNPLRDSLVEIAKKKAPASAETTKEAETVEETVEDTTEAPVTEPETEKETEAETEPDTAADTTAAPVNTETETDTAEPISTEAETKADTTEANKTTDTTAEPGKASGVNPGVIIGIVAGCAAVAAVIAYVIIKKKKK